jgi:Fur family peroxide stress response transcriptional regulator
MITNSIDLKKLLSSKRIKPTHQRLKIMKYVQESGQHPTADMIYKALVKEMPTISKTTVYNTLNAFLAKEIAMPVNITGTEVRFDYNTSSHHHLLCERCGRIIDVNVLCPNMHKKEIGGHQIKELHGYFKGICVECLQK